MDWSQWAYVTALGLVLAVSRPHWLICAAMAGNLAATLLLEPYPLSVAVADAICGTVLMMGGTRAKAVGAVFGLMVISAVIFQWYGVPNYATYAIADMLAYGQLIIIGGGGFGMVRRIRTFRRAVSGRASHPSGGVARGGAPVQDTYLSVSE